jgi:hypothetical protein
MYYHYVCRQLCWSSRWLLWPARRGRGRRTRPAFWRDLLGARGKQASKQYGKKGGGI